MTFKLRIVRDDSAESPRENENTGHMVCAHRKYKLGDEMRIDTFTEEELREERGALVVPPLALHDHGGISMTVGVGGGWDSGQVGWIYATAASIRRIGWARADEAITDKVLEQVKAALVAEVEEYDDYLRGNAWGFTLEEEKTCECCHETKTVPVDSCWGFIGDSSKLAIKDHLDSVHHALVDAAWDNRG